MSESPGAGSHNDRMSELSHVSEDGSVRMVDVGGKAVTHRVATCAGLLKILPSHRAALHALPKGDALTTAQVAGILGGKRCAELIPLCHPMPLDSLDVAIKLIDAGLEITATARTTAKTGVEMEAYTAVVVAGITLIDMLKGVDPDLILTDVRLQEKTGGKRPWKRT